MGSTIITTGTNTFPTNEWTTITDSTTVTSNAPTNWTVTYRTSEPDTIVFPSCYKCRKEVESLTSYISGDHLTVIMHCHDEERRIDIAMKRFNGCKEDAIEWFNDTFRWAFGEDAIWKNVQPEDGVSTVHSDRKILTDWLEKV